MEPVDEYEWNVSFKRTNPLTNPVFSKMIRGLVGLGPEVVVCMRIDSGEDEFEAVQMLADCEKAGFLLKKTANGGRCVEHPLLDEEDARVLRDLFGIGPHKSNFNHVLRAFEAKYQ